MVDRIDNIRILFGACGLLEQTNSSKVAAVVAWQEKTGQQLYSVLCAISTSRGCCKQQDEGRMQQLLAGALQTATATTRL